MKKTSYFIALALAGSAASATAQPLTVKSAPTERNAPPAPSPGAPSPPTAGQLQAALEAIRSADANRLITDRAYAATILADIDLLRPALTRDPELGLALDNIRLFALVTQQRPDEVRSDIDRILSQRPTQATFYSGAWLAARSIEDYERLVAIVETASRNVHGVQWPDLRETFDTLVVMAVLQHLHEVHDDARRIALAQALFRIGWPGVDDLEATDFVRSILIEDHLRQHDNSGAADLVAGVTTPTTLLSMIVQKRYDPVLPSGREPLALLGDSIRAQDHATETALAARPGDLGRSRDRIQFLRGQGRNAEALALILPFTRDVRATVEADDKAMWVINDGAYVLAALDRNEEAVALMRRLTQVPIAVNPGLIGPFINYAEVLIDAGHPADALAFSRTLQANYARYANDFGNMWIASSVVCALARLNRATEAAPEMTQLRAHSDINPAAVTRAYLCTGNVDAAAALMVHRLQSDDPESAILVLQDYSLSRTQDERDPLYARLRSLRDRPEVREALDRVGRLYTLPLARTYYGSF